MDDFDSVIALYSTEFISYKIVLVVPIILIDDRIFGEI